MEEERWDGKREERMEVKRGLKNVWTGEEEEE